MGGNKLNMDHLNVGLLDLSPNHQLVKCSPTLTPLMICSTRGGRCPDPAKPRLGSLQTGEGPREGHGVRPDFPAVKLTSIQIILKQNTAMKWKSIIHTPGRGGIVFLHWCSVHLLWFKITWLPVWYKQHQPSANHCLTYKHWSLVVGPVTIGCRNLCLPHLRGLHLKATLSISLEKGQYVHYIKMIGFFHRPACRGRIPGSVHEAQKRLTWEKLQRLPGCEFLWLLKV